MFCRSVLLLLLLLTSKKIEDSAESNQTPQGNQESQLRREFNILYLIKKSILIILYHWTFHICKSFVSRLRIILNKFYLNYTNNDE